MVRERERKRGDLKHLSVHQWIRSAIPDSQHPTSPVGFLFLKLPPPPCAVLLESLAMNGTSNFWQCPVHNMAMWIRHLLKGTADETDEVDLQVLCLTGEGVTLSVPCSMLGYELRRLVSEKLPCKPGAKLAVHHVNTKLTLNQTLAEQGIVGKSAMLSCTYIPTNVYTAWCYVCGLPTSERQVALEGVTQLEAATEGKYLEYLPRSLAKLTFGENFNQSLEWVTFPLSLQSLSFGENFNQSLERVTLPSSLQSLSFGWKSNQSLERVTLPSSLRSLSFGNVFNQSLEQVTLPPSLQNLSFGHDFNQSLERVTLPSSLQSLSFGWNFNQSLERVTLPSSLQSLSFGHDFNQSLERVTLPSSLQSLSLGVNFNQSLERVALPLSLQSLSFGENFNQRVTVPSSLQSLSFAMILTKAWSGWSCHQAFEAWVLAMFLTKAWSRWPCHRAFKAWVLALISTKAWSG